MRGRLYRKQAEKRAAALAAQQATRGPRAKAPPAIFGFRTAEIWMFSFPFDRGGKIRVSLRRAWFFLLAAYFLYWPSHHSFL